MRNLYHGLKGAGNADLPGDHPSDSFVQEMRAPARIPFNRPYIAGKELYYIARAVALGNISGDGAFTQGCAKIFEERFGIPKVLMTTSCTSSLEMAAMLCDLGEGDEVLMPSFTFVSTANAVARTGAKPVFVDVRADTLNIDETKIEERVTSRTKVIMPVHYAGVGCEMDAIMAIAESHDLVVVEDAAQGVNARYKGRPLGGIGHLGTYSFHETKNYVAGEGGALCINDERFRKRGEILRDKGTNRQQFFRGEVDKYTWVDTGSSYVPSEITCAFLYAQLEEMDSLTERRRRIFQRYFEALEPLADQGLVTLPSTPEHCDSNCHIFYLLLPDGETRDELMFELREHGISSVFHYVPLHSAPMAKQLGCGDASLPVTDSVSKRLLRLPFYYELTDEDQQEVIERVTDFLERRARGAAPRKHESPGQKKEFR
ncbi:MAG: dTDP-4-amino-4,6-dideoxygalactose transaminase [Polyangiales bacterium]